PTEKNWLRGPDLNRRPSGYEPDELPGCSTPRSNRGVTLLAHVHPRKFFSFKMKWLRARTRSRTNHAAVLNLLRSLCGRSRSKQSPTKNEWRARGINAITSQVGPRRQCFMKASSAIGAG